MIASGYLPYTFSENLCNGKLVMALKHSDIDVNVISRVDEGPTYSAEWSEPWSELKSTSHTVRYEVGNKLVRLADVVYSGIRMNFEFQNGIRWIRRAYDKAVELMKTRKYDAVLTRSPGDMAHLVGYKLKQRFGIKWLANWNDPAEPIWPEPYTHHFSSSEQKKKMQFTDKLLRYADINTFPSNSLRNHFISHFPFLESQNTEVIPHIALENQFFPRTSALTNSTKLRLLHSGNLSQERNPELTFRAMRELIDEGKNNFEFHIMGHVNNYTEELIKKYKLEEYVKCIGSYAYMDALKKMQEYDVLVLLEAILEKGIFFASKFTDYAQCCKPILAISPSQGFARDTLTQYGGGLWCDNTDYTSIKSALLTLLNFKRNNDKFDLGSHNLLNQFLPKTVSQKYKSIIINLYT